jgi:hypothetical protein
MENEQPIEQPKSSLRRTSRAPLLLALLALVGAGIFLALRFTREPAPAEPETAAQAPVSAEPAPTTEPAAEPGAEATIDPGEVRARLETVSPNETFRGWLAQGDLLRRAAVVIDNLGEGVSPRAQLLFLAPDRPFTTAARGDGAAVIAPASYERYDRFAETIASIDAPALATAYHALRPALQSAYRALGARDPSIDAAIARALGRIAAAPVWNGDVVVEDDDGVFVYADPRLERLPEVEKHLLRMGPRNTRLLQDKAKAILEAAALDAGTVR